MNVSVWDQDMPWQHHRPCDLPPTLVLCRSCRLPVLQDGDYVTTEGLEGLKKAAKSVGKAAVAAKNTAKAVGKTVFNPIQSISSSVVSSALNATLKDFKKNNPSYDYKKELNAIIEYANTAIKEFNKGKDEDKIVVKITEIEEMLDHMHKDIGTNYKLTADKQKDVHELMKMKLGIVFMSILKKHPEIANKF